GIVEGVGRVFLVLERLAAEGLGGTNEVVHAAGLLVLAEGKGNGDRAVGLDARGPESVIDDVDGGKGHRLNRIIALLGRQGRKQRQRGEDCNRFHRPPILVRKKAHGGGLLQVLQVGGLFLTACERTVELRRRVRGLGRQRSARSGRRIDANRLHSAGCSGPGRAVCFPPSSHCPPPPRPPLLNSPVFIRRIQSCMF